MEFHLRFARMGAQCYTPNVTRSLSAAGSKPNYHRISVMQSSLPCTRTKGKSLTALTIVGDLPFAREVLARVLPNRQVSTIEEDHLPESQRGFRANRSTTDMVFVLRQLQEKYQEKNKGLYVTFGYLIKAFNTVSRKGLLLIMERLGCLQSSSAWS